MKNESCVIFSPHIDDAVLSLGGVIMKLNKGGIDVKIKNIFTITDYINPSSQVCLPKNIDQKYVTQLRKEEEKQVSKYLKFDYEFWDFFDLPLRASFTDDDNVAMSKDLLHKIRKLINKEHLYYFPLGISHPDHILIREIGVTLKDEGNKIFFYEDMPYFASNDYNFDEIFKIVQQSNLVPECNAYNFQRKSSLLKLYASQITDRWLLDMRNYSYSIKDNNYYERYWRSP